MTRLWLPLEVGYKLKKMLVFIPPTEDKIELKDLLDFAKEKTMDDLRKEPDRPKSRYSKEEIAGALKEYLTWLKRRKQK